ncbi:sporulation protein [Caloranaerobacter sp. TR13]|uniref:spore protease YyaC n=1 Tax=Caloranaerobacter sp. TR13 TaxID=1302151 RepID=UPI0006D3EF51|nr:spore protease YyaC [Caloranaerobacter sp. TR13]KPU26752.1 sporulation protein [Caloranaerobacter sp. TR13]
MFFQINCNKNSINSFSPYAVSEFSKMILEYLNKYYNKNHKELVIVCIGTDRSTGDSLGPLVGYKLSPLLKKYNKVHLLGNLDNPVHAKNLKENINFIKNTFDNPFIIAIDACLGNIDRIGYVKVEKGPLKPGAGVNKILPEIGDIHITGIVNISGFMEYIVLQNTRLSIVMKMADVISKSIYLSYIQFYKNNSEIIHN